MQPKFLILIIYIFSIYNLFSQDKIKASFDKRIDTIYSDSKEEITHSFKIIVPYQEKFKESKIQVVNIKNDLSPVDIYFPEDKVVKMEGSIDTIRKQFNIKFKRSNKDDRILTLKLEATDKNGKSIEIENTNPYIIYIKPVKIDTLSDASKLGNEFWLFTGTNFDFLDGVKVRDLYFKGSYLFNLNKDSNNKSWIYITFGKNRYFSEKDSISKINFEDRLFDPQDNDSIKIIRGIYNTVRENQTNNIFTSLDYMFKIEKFSSSKSKLFLNAGVYIGLQTIKTTFDNSDIISDTVSYPISYSLSRYEPLAIKSSSIRQYNYNVSIGFMHILYTDKINIKSHLTTGLNKFTYTKQKTLNSINQREIFDSNTKYFIQIRLDATVLNPGISLGLETFLRKDEFPLFNVSLSKVINITQLSQLFGKIPN